MAEEVEIDRLSVAIEQTAGTAANDLNKLAKSLEKLSKSANALNLGNAVKQFELLGNASAGIYDATSSLTALSNIKISTSVANQLPKISEAMKAFDDIDLNTLVKVADAANSVAVLNEVKISSSVASQLPKIGEAIKVFDGIDTSTFERVADAIQRIGEGSKQIDYKSIIGFAKNVEKLEKAAKSARKTTGGFWDSFLIGGKKADSVIASLTKKIFSLKTLGEAVKSALSFFELSSKAQETLNLASVSMATKELATAAQEYATAVQDSYGVDSMEFLKYQSTVMDISRSFGIATDTAYKMSKALTQLTYDYSSFYNISVSDAATKMQQVITGELEGIRRLGKDISVANLQVQAANLGISTSVDNMTQAQKAMLRTISVLKQSTSAMGDMARTLDSSANQMRILQSQWTLFKRAIGDLVLPIMQKVLPYLTATAKVAREVVVAFTGLWGIELPSFDWSDSANSAEDLAGAVADTTAEVKKLYTLSFDQLNILGSKSSSSDTAASLADIAKLEAELDRLTSEYDAVFSEAIGKTSDKIADKLRSWITQGKSIEEWASGVNDKFIKLKNSLSEIVAVLAGAAIVGEIVKLATYIDKLAGINELVPKITKNFDNKTNSLEKQTEATATETAAVTALIPQYAGLVATLAKVALGVGALTTAFKWLSGGTAESTATVNASVSGMTQSASESFAAIETSATELTGNLIGLGTISTELAESSGRSIFNTVESYSSQLVATSDLYGSQFYDSMTSVVHDIDTEYATVFDNIYRNYSNLMSKMGVSTDASAYKSTTATKLSSAEREKVRKRGQYLQKAVDESDSYNYAASITGSNKGSEGSSALEDYLKKSNFQKTIINGVEYTFETIADILKKVLSVGSLMVGGVPAFASGGIVEDGFFFANSTELVGRFSNGKTAVANNVQITEGIEKAVYRAVSAALKGRGGAGKVELVLDKQVVGRVFGDAIESEKRRSGANTNITFSNGGR